MNWFLMGVSNLIAQLLCIHHTSRYSHCSRPVEIIECLEIGQLEEKVLGQISVIISHCVMSRCTTSLVSVNILGSQKEIKVSRNNLLRHYCSRLGIIIFSLNSALSTSTRALDFLIGEEFRVNLFVDQYISQLNFLFISITDFLEAI